MKTTLTLNLNEFLPYRLSRISNKISHDIESLYQERFGLKMNEWRVMAVIGDSSPITAQFIVDKTLIGKVNVSRAIQQLEKKKLILRQVNEEDRRQLSIQLSKEGQEIHDSIVPIALAYEHKLKSQLTHQHQHQLLELIEVLDSISENLNKNN